MEAISMYIGDGKLSADLHHLEFTSIDKDMLDFMSSFFVNRFNLNPNEFTNRQYAFQINGKIFRILFKKIIDKIYESNFQKDLTLRRAFLRGLFAAEGGIGIVSKENYIAYMAFHLSYEKEEELANFVQTLLNLEGIQSKQITRKHKGERYIQITNWKNYYKCWKIDLFNLCKRKKQKFLDKVKKTNFFFKIKKEFIRELLHSSELSHRQIALRLGIWPETLAILNKGKTPYVNRKDLLKLAEFNEVPISELKENIIDIRVNRVTVLDDMGID
jgi:DNA-binding Xre family transcriptional regulator